MTGQSTLAPLGRSTTTTVELRSPSGKSPRTCWRGKAHFIQVCWLFNLRQWLRLLFSCRVTHDGFSTTMLSEYHSLKAQAQTAAHVLNIIAVALQNLFALLQGTTAERLSQDGSKQFSQGHGLQTRGLAGQSHNKYDLPIKSCSCVYSYASEYSVNSFCVHHSARLHRNRISGSVHSSQLRPFLLFLSEPDPCCRRYRLHPFQHVVLFFVL